MSPDPTTNPDAQRKVPMNNDGPTEVEKLLARTPDLQAPAYTRQGQREYLRRARKLYAANLGKTGLNRATRRRLSREVSFA